MGPKTAYNFQRLYVFYGVCLCTQSCAISVDLSGIFPQFQNIAKGSFQTSSFTVTDRMSGLCGVVLNIQATVVPPIGGSAALITVDTTLKSIAFAASDVLTDSGIYTVIVEAGFGTSSLIASA
jgi:hypothetical protein